MVINNFIILLILITKINTFGTGAATSLASASLVSAFTGGQLTELHKLAAVSDSECLPAAALASDCLTGSCFTAVSSFFTVCQILLAASLCRMPGGGEGDGEGDGEALALDCPVFNLPFFKV